MLRDLSVTTGNMRICGTHLVGVPASELPSGFPLNGLINNDIDPNDPVGCLYRVEVVQKPSSGVLTIEENGAFSLIGAVDGIYTGPVNNYKNDVLSIGSYRFTIGAAVAIVTGVTITPGSITMQQNTSQQFAAVVNGTNSPAQGVTWSKTGPGTLSTTGLYVAPAATSSIQIATIIATSIADPSKASNVAITIPAAAIVPTVTGVSVTPNVAVISGGASVQMSAVVTGTNNPTQDVTWSVSAGSISGQGLFVAPATIPSDQIITVTATSVFDSTKSGTSTITVLAGVIAPPTPVVTGVTITPEVGTIPGNSTHQFTAIVEGTNSPSQVLAWSVNVGTISSTGLYTAPASIFDVQEVIVTAISVQDATKSDTEVFYIAADGSLIQVAPYRVLRTIAGNQLERDSVVTDEDTYYVRLGRWYIDKDPDDILYYARDVGLDLEASNTTIDSVELIVEGVTLVDDFAIQGTSIVMKVAGGNVDGEIYNLITVRVTCTNGEVFDRSIYFSMKQS